MLPDVGRMGAEASPVDAVVVAVVEEEEVAEDVEVGVWLVVVDNVVVAVVVVSETAVLVLVCVMIVVASVCLCVPWDC